MKIKSVSKQALAVLLSLSVLASTLMLNTFSVFAAGGETETGDGITYWNCDTSEPTADTNINAEAGSAANPYLINNGAELAYLANLTTTQEGSAQTNGKYYRLEEDIYLNDITLTEWQNLMNDKATAVDLAKLKEWTYGVHTGTSPSIGFGGTLLGNNHKIFGLYSVDENRTALFKGLIGTGTIKNLGIENSYIESTNGVAAALIGYAQGSTKQTEISNCYVDESVIVKAKSTASGLVYAIEYGETPTSQLKISNTYSAAQLKGSSNLALVGFWYFGTGLTIENCYGCQANTRLVNEPSGNKYENYKDSIIKAINNCYATSVTKYWGTDASNGKAYIALRGIDTLTPDQMKGRNAVTNMPVLFSEDSIVKWYVMTGETPKLLSFTGLTSIQTGDLNLDDKVDILDLVKLAQRDSGAVINESNKVIIDGTSAENSKAALKRILLG